MKAREGPCWSEKPTTAPLSLMPQAVLLVWPGSGPIAVTVKVGRPNVFVYGFNVSSMQNAERVLRPSLFVVQMRVPSPSPADPPDRLTGSHVVPRVLLAGATHAELPHVKVDEGAVERLIVNGNCAETVERFAVVAFFNSDDAPPNSGAYNHVLRLVLRLARAVVYSRVERPFRIGA